MRETFFYCAYCFPDSPERRLHEHVIPVPPGNSVDSGSPRGHCSVVRFKPFYQEGLQVFLDEPVPLRIIFQKSVVPAYL